jgi:hypothetical protein
MNISINFFFIFSGLKEAEWLMKQLRRVPLAEVVDDIIVEESLESSQNVYVRVYRITIFFKGIKRTIVTSKTLICAVF